MPSGGRSDLVKLEPKQLLHSHEMHSRADGNMRTRHTAHLVNVEHGCGDVRKRIVGLECLVVNIVLLLLHFVAIVCQVPCIDLAVTRRPAFGLLGNLM